MHYKNWLVQKCIKTGKKLYHPMQNCVLNIFLFLFSSIDHTQTRKHKKQKNTKVDAPIRESNKRIRELVNRQILGRSASTFAFFYSLCCLDLVWTIDKIKIWKCLAHNSTLDGVIFSLFWCSFGHVNFCNQNCHFVGIFLNCRHMSCRSSKGDQNAVWIFGNWYKHQKL